MARIDCKGFSDQLDNWLGGHQSPDARAHVESCPRCSALLQDMNVIAAAAREWGQVEFDPPPRVWNALRARIAAEGLERQSSAGVWQRVTALLRPIPRPVLAGGYLAVLVALVFGLSGPVHDHINQQRWLAATQETSTPLSAQLNTVESGTVSAIPVSDPVVTASLHQNLAIVDNYITLCEKTVREEPQNAVARDYLYDAYQQKANLLSQMSERGDYRQ